MKKAVEEVTLDLTIWWAPPVGDIIVSDGTVDTIHTPLGTPQQSTRMYFLPAEKVTVDRKLQVVTMPRSLAVKKGLVKK